MDKPVRRKQPTVKGNQKHAFMVRIDPGLFYRLEGLAQARGVSIASLLTESAEAQLAQLTAPKTNDNRVGA
jgi:hypothetical protein